MTTIRNSASRFAWRHQLGWLVISLWRAIEIYSKTFSSIISGDSLKVKYNVKYLRKYIGHIKIIFYALNNILNQYFRKSVWWRWQLSWQWKMAMRMAPTAHDNAHQPPITNERWQCACSPTAHNKWKLKGKWVKNAKIDIKWFLSIISAPGAARVFLSPFLSFWVYRYCHHSSRARSSLTLLIYHNDEKLIHMLKCNNCAENLRASHWIASTKNCLIS